MVFWLLSGIKKIQSILIPKLQFLIQIKVLSSLAWATARLASTVKRGFIVISSLSVSLPLALAGPRRIGGGGGRD